METRSHIEFHCTKTGLGMGCSRGSPFKNRLASLWLSLEGYTFEGQKELCLEEIGKTLSYNENSLSIYLSEAPSKLDWVWAVAGVPLSRTGLPPFGYHWRAILLKGKKNFVWRK